jgi:hypothetical protein
MRSRYAKPWRPRRPTAVHASTSPAVLVAMSNAYLDMRSDCHRDARWQTDLSPLS